MRARLVTTSARGLSYFARSADSWSFLQLKERRVVLNGITGESDAMRSRRQEAGRNQTLLAAAICVLPFQNSCLTEILEVTVTNGQALLIDRLASRKAYRLSAGHRTNKSRQSNPSCRDKRWVGSKIGIGRRNMLRAVVSRGWPNAGAKKV